MKKRSKDYQRNGSNAFLFVNHRKVGCRVVSKHQVEVKPMRWGPVELNVGPMTH